MAKFMEKRGEGIHHLAIRVENLEAALAELKEKGYGSSTKNQDTEQGAQKSPSYPKSTGGVLLESASGRRHPCRIAA